jgi:hypothetical protein
MEARRKELAKLKVSDLKSLCPKTTSTGKKKSDLIDAIIRKEFPPEDGAIKRVKIAPVFLMAKSKSSDESASSFCILCEGSRSVWSELGQAVCPVCVEESFSGVIPSPTVKQERGVTSVAYRYDMEGRVVFKVDSAQRELLGQLVTLYGFGICESIEALNERDTVEGATELLISRNRSSAENASIAEAQLNSEQTRNESRDREKNFITQARCAVEEDLTVLLGLDSDFCSKFLFCDAPIDAGRMLQWLLEKDTDRTLLFDYLSIKRDSIKWYKASAAKYFDRAERDVLATVSKDELRDLFSKMVEMVSDAVFNIPSTGGAVPLLFRDESEIVAEDDSSDIEVISDRIPERVHSHQQLVLLD